MFQPAAGEILRIGDEEYKIEPHPAAPNLPFGQEGRQATVYKLSAEDGNWALKVFKPRYRQPLLVRITGKMGEYSKLPGMEVCRRSVVRPGKNLELLKGNPDLIYAALMPWVEGPTWMELVLSRRRMDPELSLKLAMLFLKVLVSLEEDRLSHGDLSGANILIPFLDGGSGVSLVDVEQLCIPGMEKPDVLPEGSPGYAFPNATGPLWGRLTDRYPGSVLIAEMLAFCDDRVIENSYGETFFSEEEIGRQSTRFSVMVEVLKERWGDQVAGIFRRNWFAETIEDCSPFAEWMIYLPDKPKELQEIVPEAEPAEALAMSVPHQAQDPEKLLVRATQLESQGELRGAVEIYRYILEVAPLRDDYKGQIIGKLAYLENLIRKGQIALEEEEVPVREAVQTPEAGYAGEPAPDWGAPGRPAVPAEAPAEVAPLPKAQVRPRSKGGKPAEPGVALPQQQAGAEDGAAAAREPKYSYETRRWFTWKKLALFSGGAAFILIALFLLGMLPGPWAKAKVPELKDKTVEQAETELNEAGLKKGEQTEGFSGEIQAGNIISQAPAAGAKLAKGGEVDIVVNKGREVIAVPVVSAIEDFELDPGEQQEITLQVKNEGAKSDAQSYLSMSVSGGLDVDYVSGTGSNHHKAPPPTSSNASASGKEVELKDVALDCWDAYSEGQERNITVRVTARDSAEPGQEWIKYRLAFLPEAADASDQTNYVRYPNSGNKDQMGWHCKNINVTITSPDSTDSK